MWKLRINTGLVLLGLGLVLVACQPQAKPAAAGDAVAPGLSVLLAMPTTTAVPPSPPTALPTLTPMPVATDTAVLSICIPVQPNGWVLTAVQPGNTLFGLARRGGTTVAELMRVNCRENDILYVGELLYTPPGSGYTVMQPPGQVLLTLPSVQTLPPVPPPTIPPAPPPCETPPCEEGILPTLPPPGESDEPSLLPTALPDELPLLPTLPPAENEE